MLRKRVNTEMKIEDLRQSSKCLYLWRNQIKHFVSQTRTLLKLSCARRTSDVRQPRCGLWVPEPFFKRKQHCIQVLLFHTYCSYFSIFLLFSYTLKTSHYTASNDTVMGNNVNSHFVLESFSMDGRCLCKSARGSFAWTWDVAFRCAVAFPPGLWVGGKRSSVSRVLWVSRHRVFHFNNISPFIIRPVMFIVVCMQGKQCKTKGRGVQKTVGRKVMHSQSRETVISVYSFTKKEDASSKSWFWSYWCARK
jgi:hypothetical protein